jgi:hypothetical protein
MLGKMGGVIDAGPAPDERIGRCGFIGRLVIFRTHAMQRDGRREHEHETR